MQLDLPGWAASPGVVAIFEALPDARFVGGAVRDLLLGRAQQSDIDVATALPPEEVMKRLGAARIRTLPTGLAHGTVTALLGKGAPVPQVEITTLRRDVATDGRHAEVAFSDDWREDAARRDFTMNALSLDRHGQLWDYFGGVDDCLAGHVRFIGEPLQRIEEDYLRILRFYRFEAWFGSGAGDPAARAACADQCGRLRQLSAERIRVEILKLLAAPRPERVLAMMVEDGVWSVLFPQTLPQIAGLGRLLDLTPDVDELLRLAVLVADAPAVETIAEMLKLSNVDRKRLREAFAAYHTVDFNAPEQLQKVFLYRFGQRAYSDALCLHGAQRISSVLFRSLQENTAHWIAPLFPLKGGDLLAAGIVAGPEIGRLLSETEAWWVAHDFMPERPECLAHALNKSPELT